jgi:tRNA dimethylallyltransferase
MIKYPFFLVIHGPTGVGKTSFVDLLATHIPIEIVNMDSGQFYEPLTIGTAKPQWRSHSVPHHLFDIFSTPHEPTVVEYRARVLTVLREIHDRQRLPVLVGGSGFYLKSLLYPPYEITAPIETDKLDITKENSPLFWQELAHIDPIRAAQIHPHDAYRIQRALAIWHATGIAPSAFNPSYNPPMSHKILYLTRDKKELNSLIALRTLQMLNAGWIEEVQSLSPVWVSWVMDKKIIGYCDILDYLSGKIDYKCMYESIVHKTNNYAKRQETFWRALRKNIFISDTHAQDTITEINLTTTDVHLYIMKLSKILGTTDYISQKSR